MSCAVMTIDDLKPNSYPVSPPAIQGSSASTNASSSEYFKKSSPNFEQQCRLLEDENQSLKLENSRLQQQCSESQRRDRILTKRLAIKEQEYQEFVNQIAEYKTAQAPGPAALKAALLDPAVNLLIEKLRKELQATKSKLEETQNELSAWKFTPDSNTGKRLMAKCRLLYQENEELGKVTSNGRLAKLEGDLAMHKSFSEEVRKSQSELDGIIQELDEDVEAMQSTILFLQQELKTTKERIEHLENENKNLRDDKKPLNGIVPCPSSPKQELQPIKEEENEQNAINGLKDNIENSTENGVITTTKGQRQRKRNYDSDGASDGQTTAAEQPEILSTKRKRKTGRNSMILSGIDEDNTVTHNEQSETTDEVVPNVEGTKKILTRRKSSRNLSNGNV